MKPAIIVHGGAWDIPDNVVDAHVRGCREAVAAGWAILKDGGTSLEAVQLAVSILEDDPTFDAGRGAFLNTLGEVELDAAIMEGRYLRAGAVAAVKNIRNPIFLARKVMEETEHVLLVGSGAYEFAAEVGVERCNTEDLLVGRELKRFRKLQEQKEFITQSVFERDLGDTVGAVAIDHKKHVAAATSTGGTPKKRAGRVGDSALIGCGTYADDALGAVSTTGWGESIMKVVLAKSVCDLMGLGLTAIEAAREGIAILGRKVQGLGGVICIDTKGNIGHSFNTPRMAYAYQSIDHDLVAGINK